MCNSDGTLRQWTFWKMYKVCLKKEMRGLFKSRKSLWLLPAFFLPSIMLLPGAGPGILPLETGDFIGWLFCVGAMACTMHYTWDMTTTDRLSRTLLFFYNLGVPFPYLLFARLSISAILLCIYFIVNLAIIIPHLTVYAIVLSLTFGLLFGIIEFLTLISVRDVNALFLCMYLPLVCGVGLAFLFFLIPGVVIQLAGLFVLIIFTYLYFVKTMKGKRLRCNM